MRQINRLIFHCSATRTDQSFTVHQVRSWHLKRGWSDIGYHYYIDLKGVFHVGRPVARAGAHAKGQNADSIGICFEGGYLPDGTPWQKPNHRQLDTARVLIKHLRAKYGNHITLHGHCEYSTKTCPNFDVCVLEEE